MRLTYNQSCFPGITTAQFVEVTIGTGFSNVELRAVDQTESMDGIVRAVGGSGLVVEAVNALTDWALPDDPDPEAKFRELLDLTVAVSAPLMVCVAPVRHSALPTADIVATSATDQLTKLAAIARKKGVALALEQVGRSSSRPGGQSGIHRLLDALGIVQRAAPDVRLVLDAFNLATADESFSSIAAVPRDRIGIAHVADVARLTGVRTFPGGGILELPDFVRNLRAVGFQGAFSLEYFPRTPWSDPLSFARHAAATLRRLAADGLDSDSHGAPI